MTPKSLLRHPRAVSSIEDLAEGCFEKVLKDTREEPAKTSRILLCSGKVYYDLAQKREESGRDDVAILRVEQLYPNPMEELEKALAPYADETPLVWVQEEPLNMGAWPHLLLRMGTRLFGRFTMECISRPESASPATGSNASHKFEQELLLNQALELKG